MFETRLNKIREITVKITNNKRLLKTSLILSLGLEVLLGLVADFLVFFTLFFLTML
jgi:hypothetical protein